MSIRRLYSERTDAMGRSKRARKCPRCGSKNVLLMDSFDDGVYLYLCADCDHEFEVGGYRIRRRSEDFDTDDHFDQELAEDDRER